MADRLAELEAEIPPEELAIWLEAMTRAAKPARYIPGKELIVEQFVAGDR